MKKIFFSSIFFILSFAVVEFSHAGVSMKLEGTCRATQLDRTVKTFKYFSSFNGCKNKSSAAYTTKTGDSVLTGVREFVGDKDVYTFSTGTVEDTIRLTFANSTGNTSGTMTYYDDTLGEQAPRKRTIKVTCEIRDYEYAECP